MFCSLQRCKAGLRQRSNSFNGDSLVAGMRKYLITSLLLTCCFVRVAAQQRPYYTQYVLNNFIVNPAIAGIENYWDAKISHRHQWIGFDGAPVTTYFSIQGPLTKSGFAREDANTVRASGSNPRGQAYWNDYHSTDPHHGLGVTILNDKTGPINRFMGQVAYAYHLPLDKQTSISGGIALGFQNVRLNVDELFFGNQYPVDPAVAGSGYLNKAKPDIAAGVWLYSKNYFAGISAQQIIPLKVGFSDGKLGGDSVTLVQGRLIPHLFIQGGYRFSLGDDMSLLTSAMVKYINPVPLSVDINLKLQYRDIIWAGVSARPNDGFAALVGLNVNSSFNFGYSYDFTQSKLNTVSKGTHEILLGFLLGNNNDDWCPRNIW